MATTKMKTAASSEMMKPPSTSSSSSLFDTRKFLIAAIFIWIVHTWIVGISTVSRQTTISSSNAPFLNNCDNKASLSSSSSSSSSLYSLAKDQSNGFFNDITNDHWKTLQTHHAKLFPNYYSDLNQFAHGPGDRKIITNLRNSNKWNGQNFQVEFICPLARRLPSDSMADGPKWVCNPHRIAQQKECLIYSVGSNGKAEFEKAVKEEIGDHCEVHTFDPVSHNNRNGDFKTALHPYSTFHHWGLSNEALAKDNPKKYKTLQQTMAELGHTGKTIDVFKIDCEWCEWFTYEDWLTVDMRQILVETHNAPMPNARNFFFNLHDKGFVIFSKEANYDNGAGGVEFAFVKVSTDFFLNDTMYYKRSA